MQVYKELKKDLFKASSLALGVFDGVHAGHQKVIKEAVTKAKEMNITSAVVTFSSHPRLIVSGSAPCMITSLEDRLKFFEELGVDAAVVIDFDENLAKLTAEEYLENVLRGCLNVKSISVGYNHKFGSDKKGTSDFLKQYCIENNIQVSIISPVKIDNHTVSSSVIRGFLTSGDVSSATKFLGRPFKLKGKVVKGQQLGKKIGFPTANLDVPEELILPLSGVYLGNVILHGKKYYSVINVGKKPTVGNFEKDIVEAHLLNFDEDIYGEEIEVSFQERIRDERKFDSLEELKEQIAIDCNYAAQYK